MLPARGRTANGRRVRLRVPDDLIDALAERVLERLENEPERRFLSKKALADHLGVSERRIKTLREHGLPARKIGRDLYFDVDEVAEFIEREGTIRCTV